MFTRVAPALHTALWQGGLSPAMASQVQNLLGQCRAPLVHRGPISVDYTNPNMRQITPELAKYQYPQLEMRPPEIPPKKFKPPDFNPPDLPPPEPPPEQDPLPPGDIFNNYYTNNYDNSTYETYYENIYKTECKKTKIKFVKSIKQGGNSSGNGGAKGKLYYETATVTVCGDGTQPVGGQDAIEFDLEDKELKKRVETLEKKVKELEEKLKNTVECSTTGSGP